MVWIVPLLVRKLPAVRLAVCVAVTAPLFDSAPAVAVRIALPDAPLAFTVPLLVRSVPAVRIAAAAVTVPLVDTVRVDAVRLIPDALSAPATVKGLLLVSVKSPPPVTVNAPIVPMAFVAEASVTPLVCPVSVPTLIRAAVCVTAPVLRKSSPVAIPDRLTGPSTEMAFAVVVSMLFTVAAPSLRVPAFTALRSACEIARPPGPPRCSALTNAGAISSMPEGTLTLPPAASDSVSICNVSSLPAAGAETEPAGPMLIEPPAPDSRLTDPPMELTVPRSEITGDESAAGGLEGPAPPVARITSPLAVTTIPVLTVIARPASRTRLCGAVPLVKLIGAATVSV